MYLIIATAVAAATPTTFRAVFISNFFYSIVSAFSRNGVPLLYANLYTYYETSTYNNVYSNITLYTLLHRQPSVVKL